MPRPTETLQCGCVVEKIGGQWWYIHLCKPHTKTYYKGRNATKMWVQLNKDKGVNLRTKHTKFIADDGAICRTKEEMLEVNRRVELAFRPYELRRVFGQFQSMETSDWFRVNVARRKSGGLCEMARRLYRFAKG